MSRRLPAILLAFALLALLPAGAQAASKIPVVSKIEPLNVGIGETLTITGKHFVKGKGKTTVVFKTSGGRPVFVKADSATSKQLKVKVPEKLRTFLPVKKGAVGRARFRVSVLGKRLSKEFTALKASPLVGPYAGGAVTAPPPPDCDKDGKPDDADSDNDLVPDAIEAQIKTDRCKADTDGDTIIDSYEYTAALDLNVRAIPYPGKKPYPNPLDVNDASIDFDGDVLTLLEEYQLWNATGTKTWPLDLNYSDGDQTSGPTIPTPTGATDPLMRFLDLNKDGTVDGSETLAIDFNANGAVTLTELAYNDLNHDGQLGDEEKDADFDGLSNYDESHGRLTAGLWKGIYDDETPYPIAYLQPDLADPDGDGDGLVDGLDDQDYDGWSNLAEISRALALGGAAPGTRLDGRVNPFNPCLPRNGATNPPAARDCMLHPPIEGGPAPFDDSPPFAYAVLW